MQKIVIACEDIFGAEVYSILSAINAKCEREGREHEYSIIGYISDKADPFENVTIPVPRIGSIDDWQPASDEKCVLGILSPGSKQSAVQRLKAHGAAFETIIAPWIRGPMGIEIGEGVVLSAYSCANGVHIGNYVTLVGPMLSGEVIGDYSTVMRFANVAGVVGSGAYIGNHVFVALDKTIGDGAFIEDGAIVTRSVKPGLRFTGVPARKVKQI